MKNVYIFWTISAIVFKYETFVLRYSSNHPAKNHGRIDVGTPHSVIFWVITLMMYITWFKKKDALFIFSLRLNG